MDAEQGGAGERDDGVEPEPSWRRVRAVDWRDLTHEDVLGQRGMGGTQARVKKECPDLKVS